MNDVEPPGQPGVEGVHMADITRRLGWRHLRGAPTAHVRHHRSGQLVHDGPGLSFWYRSLTAALSEVPVDDRELAMTFHARTSDFQDVAVQATVTYRISDPAVAASRIDFSIDPDSGAWRGTPLEQLGSLLTETAQQHALDVLARTSLASALVDGVAAVRERIADGLAAEPRLPATGIEVVAVRVVALRPEPEVERALRTPAREQIQQDADKATYERRAVAVERERAIAENELASRIELARREEQLVDQTRCVPGRRRPARSGWPRRRPPGRCGSPRRRPRARCGSRGPRHRRRARSARRGPRPRRPGCGSTATSMSPRCTP
jgi:regulator of protease activity HflC (stomatin/prohibitin superfamily)